MTRKLLVVLVILSGLAVLAFWIDRQYLPRPRPGSPPPDSPAGRLLASDEFPVVLWMPYPHQNLSFLRATLGAGSDSLRSLARLAGLPAPGVPSFGPLAVPPASEIALASDEAGERYAVFAEVYPAFAAFARLAGRLADNPWLAGGEIYVEGRRAEVRWLGDTWAVASPEFPPSLVEPAAAPAAGAPALPAAGEPALAIIEVRQAVRPLSAGRYRLVRRESAFEILSDGAAVPATMGFAALDLAQLDVFLFAYAGRIESLGEPARGLVCFTSEEAGSRELPRVATIAEPGGERWSLPGESILELGGQEPRQASVAGWSLAALDQESLESAGSLATRLEAFERVESGPRPGWALWLDIDAGLTEMTRIVDILAGLPIVPRRRLERWRDAAVVLRPMAERYSLLTVLVTGERAFRLRLEPAAGGRKVSD